MRMTSLLSVPVLALALAACATTPTLYQPSPKAEAIGFSEYRVAPDRYRVTFRGGPGAPREQVGDYALLRAAEIAVQEGYDWFQIVEAFGDRTGDNGGPRLSVGGGSASYGRRSSVGLGVGTSFDLGGGPAFSRTLEVFLGKGLRPQTPDAYDARDLVATLGRTVRR